MMGQVLERHWCVPGVMCLFLQRQLNGSRRRRKQTSTFVDRRRWSHWLTSPLAPPPHSTSSPAGGERWSAPMTRAWKAAHVEQQGRGMCICVCVCVFQTLSKRSWLGATLRHHNAPLYSGSVAGELLTSGCFLREAAKHRKSRLVCVHVCVWRKTEELYSCVLSWFTHSPGTSDKSDSVSAWMGDVVKQKAAWDAVEAVWESNAKISFHSRKLTFSTSHTSSIFCEDLLPGLIPHRMELYFATTLEWFLIKKASLCIPRTHWCSYGSLSV